VQQPDNSESGTRRACVRDARRMRAAAVVSWWTTDVRRQRHDDDDDDVVQVRARPDVRVCACVRVDPRRNSVAGARQERFRRRCRSHADDRRRLVGPYRFATVTKGVHARATPARPPTSRHARSHPRGINRNVRARLTCPPAPLPSPFSPHPQTPSLRLAGLCERSVLIFFSSGPSRRL